MRHFSYQTKSGQKQQPSGYSFSAEEYELFQTIYVSSGALVFSLSSQKPKILRSGSVVLLRKGSDFKLFCSEEGYRGVYFIATGSLPSEFKGPAEVINANTEIRTLAAIMEKQINSPNPESTSIITGLGRAIAWEAVCISSMQERGRAAGGSLYWTESACQALNATIYSCRTPRDILLSIPLSYRQLSRHFIEILGMSPKQYQIRRKIDEVKNLLVNSGLNITEIAMELGYSSSQHLATQFLTVTGKNPSLYRAEIINNPE